MHAATIMLTLCVRQAHAVKCSALLITLVHIVATNNFYMEVKEGGGGEGARGGGGMYWPTIFNPFSTMYFPDVGYRFLFQVTKHAPLERSHPNKPAGLRNSLCHNQKCTSV